MDLLIDNENFKTGGVQRGQNPKIFIFERVSLCSPGCPGHFKVGLEVTEILLGSLPGLGDLFSIFIFKK